MPRPKLFRDPVHIQLRYENVRLDEGIPAATEADARLGWIVRTLVDTREFQRLRYIRQNGLTNIVFHGAEHSRFTHSMGVAHLAGEMYDRIVRHKGEAPDHEVRLATCVAALLHDVGHGPFSHTLEEILKEAKVDFDHEVMTQRIIEEDTEINRALRHVGADFPGRVVYYINKGKRQKDKVPDHWSYRLVSSQLDADRLDYLLRDAMFAGLQGGFDLPRLLDSLEHLDGTRIAVDRRSIVTVEAYLVALDQMYRAVYYHRAVRAASVLLSATIRRAFDLLERNAASVFPRSTRGEHPLKALLRHGQAVNIEDYLRLGEHQIWALIEEWQWHKDKVLAGLATRMFRRRLFKTMDVDPEEEFNKVSMLRERAKELAKEALGLPSLDESRYYVSVDEPSRTSYKSYNWRGESPDESIWLTGGGKEPRPVEQDEESKLIHGLKATKHFQRLIFPTEIREALGAERGKRR